MPPQALIMLSLSVKVLLNRAAPYLLWLPVNLFPDFFTVPYGLTLTWIEAILVLKNGVPVPPNFLEASFNSNPFLHKSGCNFFTTLAAPYYHPDKLGLLFIFFYASRSFRQSLPDLEGLTLWSFCSYPKFSFSNFDIFSWVFLLLSFVLACRN